MVYYGLTGFSTWQHSFGGQAWQLAFVWFFPILECHEFSLKNFGRRSRNLAAQHPGDLVIVTGRGIHSREGLTKKHQPNECLAQGFFVGGVFPVKHFLGWIFRDVMFFHFFFKLPGIHDVPRYLEHPKFDSKGGNPFLTRRCLH